MSAPERNVSCKYGAPMGRDHHGSGALAGKVRLRRVRLDSGGYDKGGAYWGHGEPLWYAESDRSAIVGHETEGADCYFRSASRDAAKLYILGRGPGHNPNIRFYR